MAQGEHLLEVSAVGIAVQIDLARAERLENGRQIVRGVGRCRRAPRARRASRRRRRPCPPSIAPRVCSAGQSMAPDLPVPRLSMSTISRAAPQRPEQRQILLARFGRRIARARLRWPPECPAALPAAGVRIELEIDRDAAVDRAGGIERPFEAAAVRGHARRSARGTGSSRPSRSVRRQRRGRGAAPRGRRPASSARIPSSAMRHECEITAIARDGAPRVESRGAGRLSPWNTSRGSKPAADGRAARLLLHVWTAGASQEITMNARDVMLEPTAATQTRDRPRAGVLLQRGGVPGRSRHDLVPGLAVRRS